MSKIGLVILNYNSSEDTISCANKLLSFKKDYHIIIVDNNSSDDSVKRLNDAFSGCDKIDIICNKENAGYSAGNNIGMKYAVSTYNVDIVGVLNPDVIILNEFFIDEIAKVLMSNDKFAVAGGIALTHDRKYILSNSCWNIPTVREVIKNHYILNKRKNKSLKLEMCTNNAAFTECIAGCFFLAKVSVMQEFGYLDENVFLYNEENILGIKCKRSGYREVVVLDQFYIHNHIWKKDDSKKTLAKKFKHLDVGYKSRKYLCKTYYNKLILFPLALVESMNRIIIIMSTIKASLSMR